MAQSSTPVLRIGSRGSPLALVQAREVQSRLAAACGLDAARIEIKVIRTTGDVDSGPAARPTRAARDCSPRRSRRRCSPARSISRCIRRRICRPCCRRAWCCRHFCRARMRATPSSAAKAKTLRDLPRGAVVGTASLRRQALVKRLRPDLAIVPLRGNVETRLRKIEAGEVDATLLAVAGLKRLGLLDCRDGDCSTSTNFFRPSGRARSASRPAPTTPRRARWSPRSTMPIPRPRLPPSAPSSPCSTAPAARRSAAMRGSTTARVHFRGIIVKPDGSEAFEVLREGRADQAAELGADAGRELQSARRRRFLRAGLTVRLLLTRPEPDAQRTAAALRAHGHDVVVAPLLRIEPAADAQIGAGPWAAILITSANAAHAVCRACASQRLARAAGFRRRRAQRRGHARRPASPT